MAEIRKPMAILVERAGFEPAIEFPLYTLSRRAPSTTRTPLHKRAAKIHYVLLAFEYFFSISSSLFRDLFR